MILELAAIASTVAGALLLRKKSTDEETKTDYAPDVEVEEAPEGDFEPVVDVSDNAAPKDPRDNELYFGSKTEEYDPFYDYSQGGVYAMSKYQLSSIEGNDETLAQGYRMRIVRPFFGFETSKRPKTANGQYRNNGLPIQTIEKDGKFLNVMPFVRGDYTCVRFLLEVFNPFDFDAPLQKLRISSVSSGGKECHIIPAEVERSYYSANTADPSPVEIFDPYFSARHLPFYSGDLRYSCTSFSYYHSHYLYRFGATDFAMNDKEWSDNALPHYPSDFEILCVKNQAVIEQKMSAYDQKQWKGSFSKSGDWVERNLDVNALDFGSQNKELNAMLGYSPIDGGNTDTLLADRIPVYEGMRHPLDKANNFVNIPARNSVLLDITLPIASRVQGRYYKWGHVVNRDKPTNSKIDEMKFNWLHNWETGKLTSGAVKFNPLAHLKGADQGAVKKIVHYSGLDAGYTVNGVTKKDNGGGFLFIDTYPIDTMMEGDFRLKIAAYSDKKQSVIQGHKSGEFEKSGFSSPFFEVGMYRGARPQGTYEWWKSYWDAQIPSAAKSLRQNFNENISAAGVDVDRYEMIDGYDEYIDCSLGNSSLV